MLEANLEIKLKKLVDCLLTKAATDSEFAHQLEEIFLSNSSDKEFLPPNTKTTSKSTKDKKESFNSVEYLHKYGEVKLRDELNLKTDNELKQIFRSGVSSKVRIPKNIERQKLIDDIAANSIRTLKQGSSFL